MSIPGRIYRIGKAYLGQIGDRDEVSAAERELDASLEPGGMAESYAPVNRRADERTISRADEDLLRRAEERILAAGREIQSRSDLDLAEEPAASMGADPYDFSPPQPAPTPAARPVGVEDEAETNARYFRVLGIPNGSDLTAIQTAYENLTRRCDPRRFPDGSQGQKDAQQILERVNAAYESLRVRLDPTQNRFGKLELE